MKNETIDEKDAVTQCIENCIECHAVCTQSLAYAMESGSENFNVSQMKLLQDCSEICQLSANFMLRDSESHKVSCKACSELCEKTAIMCEKVEDDDMMRVTAEIARECAGSCSEMAK